MQATRNDYPYSSAAVVVATALLGGCQGVEHPGASPAAAPPSAEAPVPDKPTHTGEAVDRVSGWDVPDHPLSVQISASAAVVCSDDCVSLTARVDGGTPPYVYRWWPDLGEGPGPHLVCPERSTVFEVSATQPASGAVEFAVPERSASATIRVSVDEACTSDRPSGEAGAPAPGSAVEGEPPASDPWPLFSPVASGELHTCAVLEDGVVKCWGYDGYGELGYEDPGARGAEVGDMGTALPAVELGTGLHAQAVFAGYYTSCATFDGATLKCWGYSANFLPGFMVNDGAHHALMGDALPEVPLPGPVAMAEGTATNVCAVVHDGTLRCWGRDSGAAVGDQQVHDFGAVGVRRLAIEDTYVCALFEDGRIRCWGENRLGQLGVGDTTDRTEWNAATPTVDLGVGATAVAIAVGSAHACAILDGGGIKCWGNNGQGQLGLGDQEARGDEPGEMGDALPFVDLGTGRSAVAMAARGRVSCALLDDQTVKCWGENRYGQLGQGHTEALGDGPDEMGDALPPIDLGAGQGAVAMAAGRDFVCAALDSQSLKCWGNNNWGQLGQGHTEALGDGPGEMGDALPPVDLGAKLRPIATTP